MDNCVFCKIVKGEIPCHKVFENEKFLAFLDMYPRSRGHVQVIPKEHFRWSYDMDEEMFGDAWKVVHKITHAIQKTLKPDFVTYMTFGRQVEHAHLWIVPRYDSSTSEQEIIPEVKTEKEDFESTAKLIREGF